MLPVCSDVTCCYCISVGINKSSPARSTSEFIQTSFICAISTESEHSNCLRRCFLFFLIFQPASHLQPFPISQVSIRPSKEVVAILPSLRKTQLEMPSQLLTSDFTSCSQPKLIFLSENNVKYLHLVHFNAQLIYET